VHIQGFYYTLHFVLSGKGTLEMGGKTHTIREGEMFFIPPRVEMCYYPDLADPWEYVWFSFKSEETEKLLEFLDFSPEQPAKEIPHFPKVRNILMRMIRDQKEGGGSFGALAVLYEILENCRTSSSGTDIRTIRQLIDQSVSSPSFSIQQLCREVKVSHAHLLKLFKEAYGMTIKEYVVQKRLELACELLLTTNLSVKSVAYSCGFSDEIHFMKTFKNAIGTTALRYRKAHIN
ncbi:MAG: AraC family transcriptional regulator, partial [Clostridia bacterium]|nr:AraC family transcriptional regulator [Clostridia bacterium]